MFNFDNFDWKSCLMIILVGVVLMGLSVSILWYGGWWDEVKFVELVYQKIFMFLQVVLLFLINGFVVYSLWKD